MEALTGRAWGPVEIFNRCQSQIDYFARNGLGRHDRVFLHLLGLEKFRRTLCLLPTHFGHGLICNCLFPWLFGQDIFVLPPFRADALVNLGSLIDQHEITFLSSVPTAWRLVLKTTSPPKRDRSHASFVVPLPLSADLRKSIREWSRAPEVMNVYGITETGSWVAGTSVKNVVPEDGLVGEPWGSVLGIFPFGDTNSSPVWTKPCKPDEPGFVWIRTPALMKGYLGRDDLTSEVVTQGWFSTGDIGVIDERGYLYLRGRVREEINKGGQKIYPDDVDAVIERFDETVDVCTFGFSDPHLGEDVGVTVVARSFSTEMLVRLYQWISARLAAFQMPKRWYVVAEIPCTSRGKVNRCEVAELWSGMTPIGFADLFRERASE